MAGLIAGGRFQDPLSEGAAVMTFSTYKSYGGPPGGAIVTRDPDVAERVFRAVYPGLTANYDAGRLRGLLEAARPGSSARVRRSLHRQRAGARPRAARRRPAGRRRRPWLHRSPTTSPSVATTSRRSTRAGIYASTSGPYFRLGTQELVTRGLGPDDMRDVAEAISRSA